MPSVPSPFLSFRGNAHEAMDFYRTVFGRLDSTTGLARRFGIGWIVDIGPVEQGVS